jgi:hypothetical protein
VAISVSKNTTKTTYLNFKVEAQITIDQPFRVTDLADCKPAEKEYLLLLLSSRESKMFLKTAKGLRLIKCNTDTVELNKFLHLMDVGLGAVLKASAPSSRPTPSPYS